MDGAYGRDSFLVLALRAEWRAGSVADGKNGDNRAGVVDGVESPVDVRLGTVKEMTGGWLVPGDRKTLGHLG